MKLKLEFERTYKIIGCFIFIVNLFTLNVAAQNIESRFKDNEKLIYNVSFNGIPSGTIIWNYLGQETIGENKVNVLALEADAKILKLLNLTSNEKVYLDSETHLPVKVERDVVFFGNKELIQEIYNQEEGEVKIKRKNSQTTTEILEQEPPIHNILELLYFFPKSIAMEKGKWMDFNLPTQEIRIKIVRERSLRLHGDIYDTYFLIGRGARRFNLWLDKESRLPLRLEFVSLLGKIIIRRAENNLESNQEASGGAS